MRSFVGSARKRAAESGTIPDDLADLMHQENVWVACHGCHNTDNKPQKTDQSVRFLCALGLVGWQPPVQAFFFFDINLLMMLEIIWEEAAAGKGKLVDRSAVFRGFKSVLKVTKQLVLRFP